MKIVVFGGSGLIGRGVIKRLKALGHDASSASPSTGVNTLTGAGLAAALADADISIDVTNSPSFSDHAVLDFFRSSTANILAAAAATTSVQHHVALAVVGAEKIPASGYMRAKVVQEALIRAGPVPYTIVRATQFFEFVESIAEGGRDPESDGSEVFRLSAGRFQPLAADDVAKALAELALEKPQKGAVELAGPRVLGLDEAARLWIGASGTKASVVTDSQATYYGADVGGDELLPGASARLGKTTFEAWLAAKYGRERE